MATDVFAGVDAADFNIYMLSETRLNNSDFSCSLFPLNEFDTYRCDRSANTSSKEGGGGVLISVHKQYKSELILSDEAEGCEQIWVLIKNKNKKILICTLYIPPNSCLVVYNRHMNMIKKVCESADNQTTMQSDLFENTFIPISITNQIEEVISESCNDLGSFQMNSVLNDTGRIRDLFWINEPDICVCQPCKNNILYNEVHHKALKLDVEIIFTTTQSDREQYFMDFAK